MITYKRCSEVEESKVYEAFKEGFIDYIINIEMPEEIFLSRFFGPEGNSMENSFIALEGDNAVGLILGGHKIYEGIDTMRCGTMCVHPEYRGKGISQKLCELYKENAKEKGCKQLFLEVIVGNDRAINFYKRLGYKKIYDIEYFALGSKKDLLGNDISFHIKTIDNCKLRQLRESSLVDIHINWQNDIDYIEKSTNQFNYGIFEDNQLIGFISVNKAYKISLIWVHPKHRLKGIGKSLITGSMEELSIDKLSVGFPNNAHLSGFFNHIGFKRNTIEQYEMYMEI